MSVINNNIQNAVNCVSCCAFENIERENTTSHDVYIGNSQTTCACYEPDKVLKDISNFIVTECDRINVWMYTLGLRNMRTLDARSCSNMAWADMCIVSPANTSLTAYGTTRGALYAMDLTLCGYDCRNPGSYTSSSDINIGKSYYDCDCPKGVSNIFAQVGCLNCYKAGQHNVAIMARPTNISFSAGQCALMYLEASVMRIY